jgi:multiple sugar transport system permease protein
MIRGPVRLYTAVAITLIVTLFPFYWMAITSLKPNRELYNVDINPLFVRHPVLEHFTFLFQQTLFPHWMLNSLLVSLITTGLSLTVATFAGYALARLRFRGANLLGWGIFVTYLVPQTLLFLPLAQLVFRMGLGNTRWALILTYPTFLVPFGTWLLIGYFRSIPRDLEECAMVDGATRIQAFLRITLPLALPGLLSVGIFAFTLSWNEFIYALVFISNPSIKTIPVGVTSELVRGDVFFWGELMAGALLGSVPVAIIYSFFVDYFVAGLTAGAVKG